MSRGSHPERILVVDDEPNTVRVFARLLEGEGYRVLAAESAEAALAALAEGPVDAAILDHRMPGDSGLDLARAMLARPDAPIVILATGFGDVEQAVEAMKAGVYDYLTKPVSFDKLRILLARALGERRLARENADLRTRLRERGRPLEARLGESRAMEEVYRTVYAVADSDATVLIQGETGSGKELIARAVHDLSSRAERPFVKIDCGAVPPELMESELFGHERGAFTGAHARKIGRIEAAHGGTVFLDELGNLPERMQGGLLRVLESREFERVGGLATIRVDVRFLVATKDDLERKVALGVFREDLYYRLSSIPIRVPPLRERTDQIPHLLGRFLAEFAEKAGKAVSGFDAEALDLLTAYSWPGNVRELRNVVERLALLAPGPRVRAEDLPARLRRGGASGLYALATEGAHKVSDDVVLDRLSLPQAERSIILAALEGAGWNQSEAARRLGVSRKVLRTKIKNLGLRTAA